MYQNTGDSGLPDLIQQGQIGLRLYLGAGTLELLSWAHYLIARLGADTPGWYSGAGQP